MVVVGGGGREHALAWKLHQSPLVDKISMTAHNAATGVLAGTAPAEAEALAQFCRRQQVSLAVVGPEAPLAAGLADVLRAAGVAVLGPSQAAARVESSKIYAKQLMRECGVRTADFAIGDSMREVEQWLRCEQPPFVIKADGLAAGKGVLICPTAEAARQGAQNMLAGQFSTASQRLLLEKHLPGRELSFIVLSDGQRALPLATCRDYKRLGNGDTGPNTGGMGAVSPAPGADDALSARVMEEVIEPVLNGMAARGVPFCGFLYAGLMIDKTGAVTVLEFNCRLGDPEAQVLMPRLRSDLYPALLAAATGDLSAASLAWYEQTAVGVVLAAAGYPQQPRGGDVISLPPLADSTAVIFHAGTINGADGLPQTSGGRVLAAVAMGNDLTQARQRAYQTVEKIDFAGKQFRHDIGG